MPFPIRHVIPKNVGRKFSPRNHDEDYAEYFFQLPGGTNPVEKKPQRYSNADGAIDVNDKNNFGPATNEGKDNPDLVHSREEAANRVIANIIRQMASLSDHAHGVFGNI